MLTTKLTDELVFSILRPRDPDSNKGSYGMLSCVCGSERFPGAAVLAVSSALRCGAGIVRLLSVERAVASCSAQIKESIYEILPSNIYGGISSDGIPAILETIRNSSAVLCGCGMGNTADTFFIASSLINNFKKQLILDADALNAISSNKSAGIIGLAPVPAVITPHIGEMSRLTGKTAGEIKSDRAGFALRFSEEHNCITVLKDNVTYIASPNGDIYESTAGNAGLARGGSGDTLAGMISAFAVQGYSAAEAAVCGVHLHGRAADLCAARLSKYGMLPSDILTDLCVLFRDHGL